jgi:hypothetical protein
VADKTPEEEGERRSREMSDLIRALAKGSPAIEEPPSEKTPLEFRVSRREAGESQNSRSCKTMRIKTSRFGRNTPAGC